MQFNVSFIYSDNQAERSHHSTELAVFNQPQALWQFEHSPQLSSHWPELSGHKPHDVTLVDVLGNSFRVQGNLFLKNASAQN